MKPKKQFRLLLLASLFNRATDEYLRTKQHLLLKHSVYSVPFESLGFELGEGGGNYGALCFTVVLGLSITQYWTLPVL